jgi:hypothetical protein
VCPLQPRPRLCLRPPICRAAFGWDGRVGLALTLPAATQSRWHAHWQVRGRRGAGPEDTGRNWQLSRRRHLAKPALSGSLPEPERAHCPPGPEASNLSFFLCERQADSGLAPLGVWGIPGSAPHGRPGQFRPFNAQGGTGQVPWPALGQGQPMRQPGASAVPGPHNALLWFSIHQRCRTGCSSSGCSVHPVHNPSNLTRPVLVDGGAPTTGRAKRRRYSASYHRASVGAWFRRLAHVYSEMVLEVPCTRGAYRVSIGAT